MSTLKDPEKIELSNQSFRDWMEAAGHKLEELDEEHYTILTNYWINGNDEAAERQRDRQIDILKWNLIELKIAMKATWALWRQLRAEMD